MAKNMAIQTLKRAKSAEELQEHLKNMTDEDLQSFYDEAKKIPEDQAYKYEKQFEIVEEYMVERGLIKPQEPTPAPQSEMAKGAAVFNKARATINSGKQLELTDEELELLRSYLERMHESLVDHTVENYIAEHFPATEITETSTTQEQNLAAQTPKETLQTQGNQQVSNASSAQDERDVPYDEQMFFKNKEKFDRGESLDLSVNDIYSVKTFIRRKHNNLPEDSDAFVARINSLGAQYISDYNEELVQWGISNNTTDIQSLLVYVKAFKEDVSKQDVYKLFQYIKEKIPQNEPSLEAKVIYSRLWDGSDDLTKLQELNKEDVALIREVVDYAELQYKDFDNPNNNPGNTPEEIQELKDDVQEIINALNSRIEELQPQEQQAKDNQQSVTTEKSTVVENENIAPTNVVPENITPTPLPQEQQVAQPAPTLQAAEEGQNAQQEQEAQAQPQQQATTKPLSRGEILEQQYMALYTSHQTDKLEFELEILSTDDLFSLHNQIVNSESKSRKQTSEQQKQRRQLRKLVDKEIVKNAGEILSSVNNRFIGLDYTKVDNVLLLQDVIKEYQSETTLTSINKHRQEKGLSDISLQIEYFEQQQEHNKQTKKQRKEGKQASIERFPEYRQWLFERVLNDAEAVNSLGYKDLIDLIQNADKYGKNVQTGRREAVVLVMQVIAQERIKDTERKDPIVPYIRQLQFAKDKTSQRKVLQALRIEEGDMAHEVLFPSRSTQPEVAQETQEQQNVNAESVVQELEPTEQKPQSEEDRIKALYNHIAEVGWHEIPYEEQLATSNRDLLMLVKYAKIQKENARGAENYDSISSTYIDLYMQGIIRLEKSDYENNQFVTLGSSGKEEDLLFLKDYIDTVFEIYPTGKNNDEYLAFVAAVNTKRAEKGLSTSLEDEFNKLDHANDQESVVQNVEPATQEAEPNAEIETEPQVQPNIEQENTTGGTIIIGPASPDIPVAEPVPESEPIIIGGSEPEPEPVVQEPEPVVQEPEPVVQEPEPVVQEPEPVVQEPEPVVQEPEPVVQEPEPVAQKFEYEDITKDNIYNLLFEEPETIKQALDAYTPESLVAFRTWIQEYIDDEHIVATAPQLETFYSIAVERIVKEPRFAEPDKGDSEKAEIKILLETYSVDFNGKPLDSKSEYKGPYDSLMVAYGAQLSSDAPSAPTPEVQITDEDKKAYQALSTMAKDAFDFLSNDRDDLNTRIDNLKKFFANVEITHDEEWRRVGTVAGVRIWDSYTADDLKANVHEMASQQAVLEVLQEYTPDGNGTYISQADGQLVFASDMQEIMRKKVLDHMEAQTMGLISAQMQKEFADEMLADIREQYTADNMPTEEQLQQELQQQIQAKTEDLFNETTDDLTAGFWGRIKDRLSLTADEEDDDGETIIRNRRLTISDSIAFSTIKATSDQNAENINQVQQAAPKDSKMSALIALLGQRNKDSDKKLAKNHEILNAIYVSAKGFLLSAGVAKLSVITGQPWIMSAYIGYNSAKAINGLYKEYKQYNKVTNKNFRQFWRENPVRVTTTVVSPFLIACGFSEARIANAAAAGITSALSEWKKGNKGVAIVRGLSTFAGVMVGMHGANAQEYSATPENTESNLANHNVSPEVQTQDVAEENAPVKEETPTNTPTTEQTSIAQSDTSQKVEQQTVQNAETAQEEAARQAQEEAARQAQEEAARQAQEEAARQAQEEAARQAQEEAARQAQEEAARQAQEEAARQAQEEAARQAQEEAARQAQEEAARQAQEEAARQAQEEAARQAQEEAARQAQEEAARQAQEEAARQAQEEAARQAQEEAARQAQEEAARQAQEEAARQAQEEAARQAQEEAARQAQEEAAKPFNIENTIDKETHQPIQTITMQTDNGFSGTDFATDKSELRSWMIYLDEQGVRHGTITDSSGTHEMTEDQFTERMLQTFNLRSADDSAMEAQTHTFALINQVMEAPHVVENTHIQLSENTVRIPFPDGKDSSFSFTLKDGQAHFYETTNGTSQEIDLARASQLEEHLAKEMEQIKDRDQYNQIVKILNQSMAVKAFENTENLSFYAQEWAKDADLSIQKSYIADDMSRITTVSDKGIMVIEKDGSVTYAKYDSLAQGDIKFVTIDADGISHTIHSQMPKAQEFIRQSEVYFAKAGLMNSEFAHAAHFDNSSTSIEAEKINADNVSVATPPKELHALALSNAIEFGLEDAQTITVSDGPEKGYLVSKAENGWQVMKPDGNSVVLVKDENGAWKGSFVSSQGDVKDMSPKEVTNYRASAEGTFKSFHKVDTRGRP